MTAAAMSLKQKPATSLLDGGVQGDLLPIEDMPDEFWTQSEDGSPGEPRYTAKLFFRRRPQDYQRTVQLLGAGLQLIEIARLMHVHHRTVAAVREAEFARIDTYKQTVINNLRIATEVLSGTLADSVHKLPLGQQPLAYAVLADKLAQAEESGVGGPSTAPIEEHLSHQAVLAGISQLPSIEVQTTEVNDPIKTGYEPGSATQKGIGSVTAQPTVDPDQVETMEVTQEPAAEIEPALVAPVLESEERLEPGPTKRRRRLPKSRGL